jgi:OmpA-OmpF porin, OOP family
MKKMLLTLIAISLLKSADAQFIKRMADRAKNRMEQKAGEKVDKGVDEATDVKKKEKNKTTEENNNSESENGEQSQDNNDASSSSSESSSGNASAKDAGFQTYSKYDFIPGDKVIAFEDFNKTDIGDFPVRWNTNATAEVVTISGKEGKWLKVQKEGVFHPEFITDLPENFTLEFDVAINKKWNSWPLEMNIAKLKAPEDFADYAGRWRIATCNW